MVRKAPLWPTATTTASGTAIRVSHRPAEEGRRAVELSGLGRGLRPAVGRRRGRGRGDRGRSGAVQLRPPRDEQVVVTTVVDVAVPERQLLLRVRLPQGAELLVVVG